MGAELMFVKLNRWCRQAVMMMYSKGTLSYGFSPQWSRGEAVKERVGSNHADPCFCPPALHVQSGGQASGFVFNLTSNVIRFFNQINIYHLHYSMYTHILEFSNNSHFQVIFFLWCDFQERKKGDNWCFFPPYKWFLVIEIHYMKKNKEVFLFHDRKSNNDILLDLTLNNVFVIIDFKNLQ